MTIETVLTCLENYLKLRELEGTEEEHEYTAARNQAGEALNEYIQKRFDSAMLEERRRSLSITKKVAVVDPSEIKVTWDEVAKLLDALNSSPVPIKEPKQLAEKDFVRWMQIYTGWYFNKRLPAMQLTSAKLELDLEEIELEEIEIEEKK